MNAVLFEDDLNFLLVVVAVVVVAAAAAVYVTVWFQGIFGISTANDIVVK